MANIEIVAGDDGGSKICRGPKLGRNCISSFDDSQPHDALFLCADQMSGKYVVSSCRSFCSTRFERDDLWWIFFVRGRVRSYNISTTCNNIEMGPIFKFLHYCH